MQSLLRTPLFVTEWRGYIKGLAKQSAKILRETVKLKVIFNRTGLTDSKSASVSCEQNNSEISQSRSANSDEEISTVELDLIRRELFLEFNLRVKIIAIHVCCVISLL